MSQGIPDIKIGSHVAAFVRERLETSSGSSLAAGELRVAYEAWCAAHDHKPAVDAKVRGRTQSAWLRQVEELRPYPLSRSAVCCLARSACAKTP
jgi:hypothetical protein